MARARLALRALAPALALLAPCGSGLGISPAAHDVQEGAGSSIRRHAHLADPDPDPHLRESELKKVRCRQNENVTLPMDAVVVDAWYGDPNRVDGRANITEMVRKQHGSGKPIVFALDELYGAAASGTDKVLEVSLVPAARMQLTAGAKPKRPRGVTMMVQIGSNSEYWESLKSCASNVEEAFLRAGEGFELYLAFSDEVSTRGVDLILKDARARFGQTNVRSMVAENRGADIGLFLRQLKTLGADLPGDHFDLFLKVHSKSDKEKRERWLGDLCGSVDKVSRIYRSFRSSNDRLGMVGPAREVILYPHRNAEFKIWGEDDMDAMAKTWKMMQPCVPFSVALERARIVAGSFYWAHEDAVLHPVILQAADELLQSMPTKYQQGSTATTAHALERLIPTMAVAIQGLSVLPDNVLAA